MRLHCSMFIFCQMANNKLVAKINIVFSSLSSQRQILQMCNHVISFIIFGARYPDKEKGLYFQTAMQHFYYKDVTVFKKAFLFLFEHLWLLEFRLLKYFYSTYFSVWSFSWLLMHMFLGSVQNMEILYSRD